MDDAPPTVAEFVEYCRVQAGLLSGHVETMGEEADALLDEIDEELAAARDQLDRTGTERPEAPPSTDGPSDEMVDVDAITSLGANLEEKQALVEAKQARMRAFQALAEGYTDLAAELDAEAIDADTALERIVTFEADTDAPLYFDDRETLYETVSTSDDADDERET